MNAEAIAYVVADVNSQDWRNSGIWDYKYSTSVSHQGKTYMVMLMKGSLSSSIQCKHTLASGWTMISEPHVAGEMTEFFLAPGAEYY